MQRNLALVGHVCLFLWPIKSIFVNHIRLTAVSGFTSRSSGNLSVDMSLPWKLLNNMIGDKRLIEKDMISYVGIMGQVAKVGFMV